MLGPESEGCADDGRIPPPFAFGGCRRGTQGILPTRNSGAGAQERLCNATYAFVTSLLGSQRV